MDLLRAWHSSPRWLSPLLLWTGVGLFDATQTVVVMHSQGMVHNWPQLYVTVLLSWLPWALASPLVYRLDRRHPLWRRPTLGALFVHVAACAAAGLVYSAWNAALQAWLNPYAIAAPKPFAQIWTTVFYSGLLMFAILYATILVVGTMLDSRERIAFQDAEAARLNEQLSRAKLDALRRQIEPHFLFNTLNGIAGLVREGRNESAVTMIAGLSDLIRRVLDDSGTHHVPLGEEMEFVGKYLDIQKMRFGARLSVSVDVPPALCTARVPSLVLQPMVENAITHGAARHAGNSNLRIGATQAGGILTLRVYNDGPALPPGWERQSGGIGIPNVRARLQSLYGGASDLLIRNCENGVEVLLSLPFQEHA
jgi:hypothetical protein